LDGQRVIGVDLGGTKILAGVVDRDGQVEHRREHATPVTSQDDLLAGLDEAVEELLEDGVAALGFGIPSPIDQKTGRAGQAVNIPLDSSIDFRTRMSERFGLPVGLENDANAAAYAEFAAAMKLPRDTDDERATRTTALQAAARHASAVPMACVESCLELVSVAEALAGRSNVNAASDLNVAALLGEAAARGAGANVMINLPSIGDSDVEGDLMSRVMDLMSEVENLAAATHEAVGGEPRDPVPASSRA
jgi:hypothetical protein